MVSNMYSSIDLFIRDLSASYIVHAMCIVMGQGPIV